MFDTELDPKQFAETIIELAKLGPPPSLREDGSGSRRSEVL